MAEHIFPGLVLAAVGMFTFFSSLSLSLWDTFLSASSFTQVSISFIVFSVFVSLIDTWQWAVWLSISFLIGLIKSFIGCYQGIRILMDLVLLVFLKFYLRLRKIFSYLFENNSEMKLKRQMRHSNTYREWISAAQLIDEQQGNINWRENNENFPSLAKLTQTTLKLQHHRESHDYQSLFYELPGIVKRNHLGIDDYSLHARCLTGTKVAIESYHTELVQCLRYIASLSDSVISFGKKVEFFQKLSKNIGNTALCLSGGGSLSMYHMGVLRALCESGNYKHVSQPRLFLLLTDPLDRFV
jgi:hypothetical protein